jgi:hypothetical protein
MIMGVEERFWVDTWTIDLQASVPILDHLASRHHRWKLLLAFASATFWAGAGVQGHIAHVLLGRQLV